MLTNSFNEKAEHQRETDFNYSMKAEDIGRIAKNNFQEHKSEVATQKRKKRDSETLSRLLMANKILDEMGDLLDDLDGLIDDRNNNTQDMLTLAEIYESNDTDALRAYLENKGIDTTDMDEHKLWEQADIEAAKLIQNDADLTAQIESRVERYKELRSQLDPNDPNYKEKLDALDKRFGDSIDRLIDSSPAKDRLEAAQVQHAIWRKDTSITFLEDSAEKHIKSSQSNDGIRLTEDNTEVVDTLDDMVESLGAGDSPFSEIEGVLTDSFNTSANGESPFDSVLEESLENDVELVTVSETVKSPTIS